MKRLFRGEKRDFKTGLNHLNFLIFCFFFGGTILPQVPINGFSGIETFSVPSGFNRLLTTDIDFDLQTDIVLYSPHLKKICVIESDAGSSYDKINTIPSLNTFSQIIPVKNRKASSIQYAFLSRSRRIVGLFDLTVFGRINLIAKLGFDSYPENIYSADIDYDGNSEILISGSAFKGLSYLSFDNGEFLETKIEYNSSYGEAVFADISNDGYQDVAAFNLFNSELEIFYNDVSANFKKVRSIEINNSLNNLRSLDINKDYFPDLIFCSDRSINIFWGDFQSSYDSSSILPTAHTPHCYSIADFNNDSFFDIAYVDTSEGLLSIYFGKGNNNYYPEVVYIKEENLVDLYQLNTGRAAKLVLLNRDGRIKLISNIHAIVETQNLVPSVKPGAISSFDYANDSVPDYCYIEKFTTSLIFILNETNSIPYSYISVPVSDNHSEMIVDEYAPFNKGFYCFTTGKKLLEVINYDFKTNNYETHQLYIPGAMIDVKIKRSGDLTQIITVFEKDGWLKVNEYEYHDFRYTIREYPPVEKNCVAPILSVFNEPGIYYWKFDGDSLRQYSWLFRSGILIDQPGIFSRSKFPEVSVISQSELDTEKPKIISLLKSEENLFPVVTGDTLFNFSTSIFNGNSINIENEIKLHFEVSGENIYNSIYYSSLNQMINKIELNLSANELTNQELFRVSGLSGLVRQKSLDGNEYLLFTQSSEGKISLVSLDYLQGH